MAEGAGRKVIKEMDIYELIETLPEVDQEVWGIALWKFMEKERNLSRWMGYRDGVADAKKGLNVPPHILGALDWADSWVEWRAREMKVDAEERAKKEKEDD